MPDYGSRVADRAIKGVAAKIRTIYEQAAKELQAKLQEYTKRFLAKQKEKLAQLEAGEITKAAYSSWMRGQVFIGEQWKQKLDQTIKIMQNANAEAARIINKSKLNVFAENYNYSVFELEKRVKGFLNFNLYDEKSVEKLLKDNPKMLPEWKIDEKKDYKWNRKKVETSITQGIIQGENIDQITDRLVDNLCTQNSNKMNTFARTAITGAQNAGRIEQMHDAEDLGIKVKKRWLATLDNRTRDTHRDLDGQEVAVDEPFEVDGMEIMYPGDPTAEPELVYNCRCTMIQVYEGIERTSVRRDEDDNMITNMTYREWEKKREGL